MTDSKSIVAVDTVTLSGGLLGEVVAEGAALYRRLPAGTESGSQPDQSALIGKEITLSIEIDPLRHAYLKDHAIGDKLVLPATCALELLCEAAVGLFPNFEVCQVENFQILGGITFGDKKSFRLLVDNIVQTGSLISLRATLFSQEIRNKMHFKADISLCPAGSANPLAQPPTTNLCLSSPAPIPDLEEVYSSWLFHGPLFQGITRINGLGKEGVAGNAIGTDPLLLLSPPNSFPWVLDPILLDSTMQFAAVWVKQFFNLQTLPTGFKSMYLAQKLDLRKVTAQVHFGPDVTPTDLICDLIIRDQKGNLAAVIAGLTGVGMRELPDSRK